MGQACPTHAHRTGLPGRQAATSGRWWAALVTVPGGEAPYMNVRLYALVTGLSRGAEIHFQCNGMVTMLRYYLDTGIHSKRDLERTASPSRSTGRSAGRLPPVRGSH